ncbi:hypothetical protein, partial [Frankia tisae]|uniref:hypothetical protein n=1 Tax=Frankia tisae TaxID=2950104 RepID=UPI0021BF82B8
MSLVGTGEATAWFRWDPDRVAAAVTACPGVARLVATPTPGLLSIPARVGAGDRGPVAEVATYLPRRRVAGVRVRDDRIVVQVDCRYGEPLADLAGRIRAAVLCAAPDCPRVDVVIRDLDPPDGPAPAGPRTQAGGWAAGESPAVRGAGD